MRTAFLLLVVLLAACAGRPAQEEDELPPGWLDEPAPLQTVDFVDMDRYMGRWYMIANIPYFAERGNLAVYVEYRRRPDGLIDDHYTAREAFGEPTFTKEGVIEVTDPVRGAAGRITFLPPLWQDYGVLYLDADYRYTVIGHPSRDYAWVFAREPRVDETVYREMLAALEASGFDTTRVLKIPQFPEQLGAPGFQ